MGYVRMPADQAAAEHVLPTLASADARLASFRCKRCRHDPPTVVAYAGVVGHQNVQPRVSIKWQRWLATRPAQGNDGVR